MHRLHLFWSLWQQRWHCSCHKCLHCHTSNTTCRSALLVVQGLWVHPPMQATWLWFLVWGDPTCHRAAKPMSLDYWVPVLQLPKPEGPEPVLCNKRSPCSPWEGCAPPWMNACAPHSPKLETARGQQRRHSATKQINKQCLPWSWDSCVTSKNNVVYCFQCS